MAWLVSAGSVAFRQQYVEGELTSTMFSLAKKIQRKMMGGRQDEESFGTSHDLFPVLPGSHLAFSNPVLEFVKVVCQVNGISFSFSFPSYRMLISGSWRALCTFHIQGRDMMVIGVLLHHFNKDNDVNVNVGPTAVNFRKKVFFPQI